MQFQYRVSNPFFFMHQSRLDNWLRHFASSTALDQHVSQVLVKNSSRSTSIPRPFVLENSLRHCQRLPWNCVLVLGNLDSRREAEECTHCIAFELVAAYFVSWILEERLRNATFILLFRTLATVVLGLEASKSLFSQLLNSLFRAPMSFYDSTPLGRILSRVSSDLSIIDLDIHFCLVFACRAAINASSNLVVLAAGISPTETESVEIFFQKYYFSTAQELMRINGTTKSFVANHLAKSVSGGITIRAFNEEERFLAKNFDLIDTNATALCMSLLPSGTFSSGFIGMALSYGLSLNISLMYAIQNQCTIANYIISVERLNQYMHIPSEVTEIVEGNRPPANWPDAGKVEIRNLQIRYRADTLLVLSGISCIFKGGHKVGIVGTGSGKSTLIGALFLLVEPAGGKIIVDGIDISTIGLHDLRSRFGIIPQDPTLFNGTVRFNLDPLSQHSDQEIWEVLLVL
ncbi:hypothetical protein D8674_032217 [Pyrus ussuriensis x Pyrus communis]|uniref:ABC transmembrane type-1 domain-containing protein n=1 Tax=Pyrus ussuriensis x Pyrus communis TaxID=2448454 RepID=A0A5N5F1C4_9ROSA|nr:hypothetical protein D8674_032217 [Pyrus ussuriensis x Pyrus communis]